MPDFSEQMEMKMADKQIVFSEQEKQQIEAILIDKDKEEALKYLAKLLQEIKGTPGHACSPGPIR
jgi:predicted O-methyltransferase YrrM